MPASDAPVAVPSEGARPEGEREGESRDGEPPTAARELTRSDERVLAYLDDAGTEYPAFVASNTGLYAAHVESRLDALEALGLVERVTGETVYRITDAGGDALRDDCPAWSD